MSNNYFIDVARGDQRKKIVNYSFISKSILS